ncbi:membrane dipeptidase (peptidase family M19) [Halolamina pelagica]|uniref:Membrane dipeptidase (Peptidase family M19) n=1 Tax=Halolamina pelagica TaxID=699431 RepID=A0A0P7GMB8_9EURY|nr:membrane dipeptidase [Halolamina pelagica]KPN29697.1 membrane dipeptidase (peptidase family M19) [Halolamina pelagica]
MLPIIDGHNDTLLAATSDRAGGEFLAESGDGHLDLARAEDAGLAAGIFAMFVPNEGDLDYDELPPAVDHERARRVVDEQFATLHDWADATDRFRVVGGIDDLDACLDGEAVGAVPHIEGAAAVSPDLINLKSLYENGLRSLGLVWSRPNAFAHGAPFKHGATPDIGPGLTEAGFDLVEACEELGIVVDLAHLNAAGFWDVDATIDAPLVVSHAGAHAISPSSRNLTDDELDAIADSGGIVGCTFGTPTSVRTASAGPTRRCRRCWITSSTSPTGWASSTSASGRTSTARRSPRQSATYGGSGTCSRGSKRGGSTGPRGKPSRTETGAAYWLHGGTNPASGRNF